jgi:hypothetical protein
MILVSYVHAATIPFYDSMDSYTEAERLGGTSSVGTWAIGNSPGTGSAEIHASAALTYPGLNPPGNASGKGILSTGIPSSGRDRGVSIVPTETLGATNPTLYASFLMNIQAAPVTNSRLLAGFRSDPGSGGFTPRLGVTLTPNLELALNHNSLTPTSGNSSALSLNTTYLVVMGINWNGGNLNDDEVSLWINPTSLGGPTPPAADLTSSLGGDGLANPDFGGFYFILRSVAAQNGGGTYFFDEARVGRSWADVTPSAAIPEPASLFLLGIAGLAFLLRRRGH